MYFTIQRIITFIVGICLIAICVLFWINGGESTAVAVTAVCVGGIGVYVVIASLVPYKNTTDAVADEIIGRVFIELPIRFVLKIIARLDDIF
jgi:hypothetical protein